jgi:hypothetical protein
LARRTPASPIHAHGSARLWPPNTCTYRQLLRVTARTLVRPARTGAISISSTSSLQCCLISFAAFPLTVSDVLHTRLYCSLGGSACSRRITTPLASRATSLHIIALHAVQPLLCFQLPNPCSPDLAASLPRSHTRVRATWAYSCPGRATRACRQPRLQRPPRESLTCRARARLLGHPTPRSTPPGAVSTLTPCLFQLSTYFTRACACTRVEHQRRPAAWAAAACRSRAHTCGRTEPRLLGLRLLEPRACCQQLAPACFRACSRLRVRSGPLPALRASCAAPPAAAAPAALARPRLVAPEPLARLRASARSRSGRAAACACAARTPGHRPASASPTCHGCPSRWRRG